MKRYKLLKDLLFAKAGEELYIERQEDGGYFTIYKDLDKMSVGDLHEGYIENFDEWFEEKPKIYFTIDFFRKEITKVSEKEIMGYAIDNAKSLGLLFETKEKAEKHLKYLQAKEVIKQDTKGFKPNWYDIKQIKYSCSYQEARFIGHGCVKPVVDSTKTTMSSLIYFKSKEDIEESLEKHPKEWKTYLFYEQ